MVFSFKDRRDFLRGVSGMLYGAGLWMFIDGVLWQQKRNSEYSFYGYEWVPGFCSLVVAVVLNTMSFDDIFKTSGDGGGDGGREYDSDEDYFGGYSGGILRNRRTVRCFRRVSGVQLVVFTVGYTLIFLCLAGSFWIWFAAFCGGCWIGIAIFLQTMMNILASLLFMFWRPLSRRLF